MKSFWEIMAIVVASGNLLMTRFALLPLHQPTSIQLWLIKVFTSAISPLLFLLGILTTLTGIIFQSGPLIISGSCATLLYLFHLIQITRDNHSLSDLERMAAALIKRTIPPERKSLFLSRSYVLWLPKLPEPIFEQNISFYTIPGTDRQLLCDIWQPPSHLKHSGLALIYLHGGAWTFMDKDYGTRTLFRRLAAQGHVIMDVAYRLFPETGFMGMVNDAKQAIAWLKASAAIYGVNSERIIIGGGSAGAHIALLAAYSHNNTQFTPPGLEAVDLSVHGAISLYGQSDLSATYYHTCQHIILHSSLGKKKKNVSGGMPSWLLRNRGDHFHRFGLDKDVEPGMLAPMLGGTPDEKPEDYALYSPVTHVHKDCPHTLIIHGRQDILAPVAAIKEMHSRLTEKGVAVAMHLLPQTDHAFDLILPKISPSAHSGLYEIERFLAVLV